MVVVITGVSGLLGSYLIKTQPMEGFEQMGQTPKYKVHGLTRSDLDPSNDISPLLEIRPDVIIHCAANGDVDNVEKHPSNAVQSDLLGVIKLKQYCIATGCDLVTISSNAVYGGFDPPYSSISRHDPINFYGKIKSLADDINKDGLIIRPIMLYGWGKRKNWVTRLLESDQAFLVDDSFTQPTYAGDAAHFIWDHIGQKGVYNIAGRTRCSIYEFGEKIKKTFNLGVELNKIKLSSLDIAPRPVDTTFADPQLPGVESGLMRMKNERS